MDKMNEWHHLKNGLKDRPVRFSIGQTAVPEKTCLYCQTPTVYEALGMFRNAAQVEFVHLFDVCVLCNQPFSIRDTRDEQPRASGVE
jgi:hypothetical protein